VCYNQGFFSVISGKKFPVTSGKNLLPRKKTLATTDFLEMTLGAIGC
jgi:hypothetical protein